MNNIPKSADFRKMGKNFCVSQYLVINCITAAKMNVKVGCISKKQSRLIFFFLK